MNEFKNLFSPITINGVTVKNRIFMPPMGTSACSEKGEVTDDLIRYFENAAKGGVGLITMEVSDVDGSRRYNKNVLGIYDDFLIPGWKQLVNAIHKHDAKVFAQLLHAGPIPLWDDPSQLGPVGASSVPHIYNLNAIPQALTKEEMGEIKQLFVDAARRAVESGCDGVEVHCAHNHGLLGVFVSPLHNKRTDEYGGNLKARMKYPLEVIAAIRKQVGPDYPISVRISACHMEDGGLTIEDTCRMAKLFEEASVDFFDVSNGTLINLSNLMPPSGTPKALNAEYARKIKQVVSVPVGTVGRVNDPWVAEEVIATGKADVAFMGRALICDPQLPNKIMQDRTEDIRPCIGCSECVTSAMYGGYVFCSINSEVGRESEKIVPATEDKKVLIAGGGPGGLEAARVAALRGFDVTLMEKSGQLGGQFSLAAYPPMKQELADGLKHMIREVYRLGVKVELNKTVTKKVVEEYKADAVIVATGGSPIIPGWLKNSPHPRIVTAWDVLEGKETVGTNILVIGGGLVGCETADYLAEPHYFMKPGRRKITVIEMMQDVMLDDFSANRDLLVRRLIDKNIEILTNAKVDEVLADSIVYSIGEEQKSLQGIDTIVSAVGTRSENSLVEELSDLSITVIPVGDAVQARKIWRAVDEGARAAKSI